MLWNRPGAEGEAVSEEGQVEREPSERAGGRGVEGGRGGGKGVERDGVERWRERGGERVLAGEGWRERVGR